MAIALSGSLILSGSITVSGSIISTGTISMSGSIASASYALNATSASSALNATTGAYANTSTSASYALNATTFNGLASSIFATTGSNTFIGNQVVSGSLTTSGSITATGTITATTLVVQTVTSSTVYSSGSNIFGNSLANTQVFSGSVTMNPGGLFVSGSGLVGIGTTTPAYNLDVTGTGRFSGAVAITTALGLLVQASSEATIRLNNTGGGTEWRLNSYTNGNLYFQSAAGATNAVWFTSAGAATFSSTITGTTIYGSTAVCSPVGKFTSCIDAGSIKGTTGLFAQAYSPYTYNDQFEIQNESAWRLRFQSHHNGAGYDYRIVQNNNGSDVCVMTFICGCITVNQPATFASSVSVGDGSWLTFNNVNTLYSKAGVGFFLQQPDGSTATTFRNSVGGTQMTITSGGNVGIGTTSTSTEANLFLGAQGANEGGQMVLQKGTSFQCATHIDNYSNCFRIMSGTDTGSTFVNMAINHTNSAACFAGNICTPQSSIVSGQDQGDLLLISNKLDSNRVNINNNVPIAAFRICKGSGQASSASYSLIGGHLYISFNLRYNSGYDTSQSIIYPFLISSAGQGGPSLILGTPNCITGFDNSAGTTSFGISMCGVSDTGGTILVCANNTGKTIEGSSSITISMVASRTAILSNELMNLYKL